VGKDSVRPLLQVRGLNKGYGGRPVVVDLTFTVRPGEVVALRGPNGAGKTTILRCLVGADDVDSGELIFDGQPMDERSPDVRRRVASVLDDMGWFPDVTAVEHLDLLARAHGVPWRDDELDPVDSALRALRIEHVADQVPATLSSGQRRRLALATTLVRPFDLLLLDEPEQRLDVLGRAWLAEHLRAVTARGGAVLLASHDDDLLAGTKARVVSVAEFD
jgi:ABC-2 type transport system ATP-binding protein